MFLPCTLRGANNAEGIGTSVRGCNKSFGACMAMANITFKAGSHRHDYERIKLKTG